MVEQLVVDRLRRRCREIPRGIDLGINPMVYGARAGTGMALDGRLAITNPFDLPPPVPSWSVVHGWHHILKTGVLARAPWVRIPPPPPTLKGDTHEVVYRIRT